MAVFRAYDEARSGFDFTQNPFPDSINFQILDLTNDYVVGGYEHGFEVYVGRFDYGPDGVDGIVHEYYAFPREKLRFTITDVALTTDRFFDPYTKGGNDRQIAPFLSHVFARDDVLIGSRYNDTLIGFGGNDRIVGGGGYDRLLGGGGNDYLLSGPLRDVLDGGSGNDRLISGASNDYLNGGTGVDLMQGGDGNDRYTVDSSHDRVFERPGEGVDIVLSSTDYAIKANVEKLMLTGLAPVRGIGNDGDNEITGNGGSNLLRGGAGNDRLFGLGSDDRLDGGTGTDILSGGRGDDRLDGGVGMDILMGGRGDDLYIVDHPRDRVVEELSLDTDTVISTVSYVMTPHVEKLVLRGDAFFGIGNDQANEIRGTNGANLLRGSGGDDVVLGGGGEDRIEAEAGLDRIAGGSGADVFLFRTPEEAGLGGYRDTILDFERGDILHLAAIDANTLVAGNQACDFIGAQGFSNTPGELRYAGGVLAGDVNGDGGIDFQIAFANGYALQADDILL